jgi:hypothetical protein
MNFSQLCQFAGMQFVKGKAISYQLFAYAQVIGLFVLAFERPETNWTGFAAVLAAVNVSYFGGGAMANHSDKTAAAKSVVK